MANGDERIKSMADLVTEHTNDEDGVAEVIEKYFANKKGHKEGDSQ
jgi:hydroxymethylpyrimidine pyrophosphatase-like HAD family hydrolase